MNEHWTDKPCRGDAWVPQYYEPTHLKSPSACKNCNNLNNGITWGDSGKCLGLEGWAWISLLIESSDTIE